MQGSRLYRMIFTQITGSVWSDNVHEAFDDYILYVFCCLICHQFYAFSIYSYTKSSKKYAMLIFIHL